jgi:transposase-like protein
MKPEDLLTDAFLQQFKSGNELTTFLEDLYKRGVEKILEGKLDSHLDYEKHQKRINTNARNGYTLGEWMC